MSTIRIAKRLRFTAVSQDTVEDGALSYRARGVLVWLLAKPDDWRCDSAGIARAGKEGREAIRQALYDLERAGYLRSTRTRQGNLWVTETVVYERPAPEDERTSLRVSPRDRRKTKTIPPGVGFPDAGTPDADHPDDGAPDVGGLGAITNTRTARSKPKESVEVSTDATMLTHLLIEMINGRPGNRKEQVTDSGLVAMDRLLRLDNREPKDIERVLRWLDRGADPIASFWAPNIRSPQKLREHWDQMAEQYRNHRGDSGRTRQTNLDVVREAYRQEKEAG